MAVSAPRFNSLSAWLDWQSGLHPNAVDLGLPRVRGVADRMGLLNPAAIVITVAGTNGKGSAIACLESIYRAHGYHVVSYTSPHIKHYNERIRLDTEPVSDTDICAAFDRIDQARAGQSLTYFEFGTLAALDIFAAAQPDIILLEVGLGGRLDAVNIIDADVALVMSIDIDHCEWLGNDRELIGREKAGIFRHARPAICADSDPPDSLRQVADDIGAEWYGLGEQFEIERTASGWNFVARDVRMNDLPLPALPGDHQLDNAAGAIMAIQTVSDRAPVSTDNVAVGLKTSQLAGRCQRIDGDVELIIDVAHNPASARALAACLSARLQAGRCRVLLGMLDDKDVHGFVEALAPVVDGWCLAGLQGDRGLSADALNGSFPESVRAEHLAENVAAAWSYLQSVSLPGDRVVVCGSFQTVAALEVSRV